MGSIALFAAAVLATLGLICGRLRPSVERPFQLGAISGVALAVIHVAWLLATEDTSYEVVVSHTRPGLSVVRRVMGLWGGSAGSLLLFTLIIGGVLVFAPVVDRLRAGPSFVLAVLAWASALAASPFERLDNPAIAGSGLSPILEHWAMIIHPPLLYLGLALSLVPAIVDPAQARRWAAAAISVLTIALALGGGWAYVELGWGGWYAWDPVENVALIPWMLLVAGIHVRPSHPVSRWSALLVWPTVFAGTAMTRTSLRTSVHAFANSDDLGWALWPLAAVSALAALAVGITTARGALTTPTPNRRLVPIVLLISSASIVALGTFRPFLPGDGTDGTFYSRFLFPIAIVGLIGIGAAPRWRTATRQRLGAVGTAGAIVGLSAGLIVGWTNWWQLIFAASIGTAVLLNLDEATQPLHRRLAHLGMVCVLAGTLGGTTSISQTFPLDTGESIEIDGHTITNNGVEFAEGPPPVVIANMTVDNTDMRPAVAVYAERRLRLPEVATRRRLHEDIQLILRSADDDGSVLVTANVQPLTQFVWLGAALIALALAIHSIGRRPRPTFVHSTIKTDRLVLTPLSVKDAPVMVDVLANESLYSFTGGEPPLLDTLQKRYTSQVRGSGRPDETWCNWIIRTSQNEAVGFVQATVIGTSAEVAWLVDVAEQGNGIATEAARAVCDWLATKNIHHLIAHIHPTHTASQIVAKRIGLAPSGDFDEDGEEIWKANL